MVSGTTPVNALNLKIARRLDEVAQVLSEQGANPYRIQAYRNAASSLRCLVRSVDVILNEAGEPGLRKIPGIDQLLICLAGLSLCRLCQRLRERACLCDNPLTSSSIRQRTRLLPGKNFRSIRRDRCRSQHPVQNETCEIVCATLVVGNASRDIRDGHDQFAYGGVEFSYPRPGCHQHSPFAQVE